MSDNSHSSIGSGITLGMMFAFALSWVTNHDFIYAVIHAIFSWIYVAYWLCIYGPFKQ